MSPARKALSALVWLALAALPLAAAPQSITEAQGTFPAAKPVGQTLCLLIDGVHVAVFGTSNGVVVGVLAYPNPSKNPALLEKMRVALELENTDIKYFGDKKRPAAFMLCKGVVSKYAKASAGAFAETLGEALAFVAAGGDFSPDKVTDDAFVWKMSGSNMQVAFPITADKIQVLEAIGAAARSMNAHKAEKLWEKLGMSSDGKEVDRNTSKMIAQFIGCDAIFFTNRSMDKDFWKKVRENKREHGGKDKKVNMSVVRTEDKRILLGDEEILRTGNPGRHDFDTFWPTESATWPGALAVNDVPEKKKEDKPKKHEPVVLEETEDEPETETEPVATEQERTLTPEQAMDEYLQYLQEL